MFQAWQEAQHTGAWAQHQNVHIDTAPTRTSSQHRQEGNCRAKVVFHRVSGTALVSDDI